MGNELIIGYKLLVDKIADKYGINNQVLLYSSNNLVLLSKSFNQELSFSALLWLGTMLDREHKIQEHLVEQVNLINKEQRERFAEHCKVIGSIIPPHNVISLN